MANTTAQEVYDSFEASFQDKCIIPDELELVWLRKAVSRYSVELDLIVFNEEDMSFETELDGYSIDILAAMMKQSYQEREVSKANKRISIVTKDISIDGNNGGKVAAREELHYDESKSNIMIQHKKPTAYV